ncbi:hypothetical protein [Cellulomonas sp. P5_C5]
MTEHAVVTAHTDAGMLALWCVATFDGIDGYDAWASRVEDRVGAAISGGELVPVNIRSDGAYGVRVAVSPDTLTERESRYTFVSSEPYLLVVTGEEAALSGIEHIGYPADAAVRVPLPAGRYAVRVTVLDWDRDPESVGPDGEPTKDALPDFVVHIAPETGQEVYRVHEETFDRVG